MSAAAVWNVQSQHRNDIHVSVWLPAGRPRAVIQLFHGMAEHIARYDRPAMELAKRGYAVVGHNHQGHGPETPKELLGYFYDKDGWISIMEDGYAVTEAVKKQLPGIPLVLLGHSMGSFLAREYVLRYGDVLDGLILSGTGWYPATVCSAGALIAGVANPKKPAPFVDKMAFSGNNKPFAPARTPFDWLSRDKAEVDKYIADPYCGFTFTGRAFHDFFDGLKALTVQSSAGTAAGDTALTVTGYTLQSGESWAYKVTTGTAATVLPGEVVSGWTAWNGTSDITAATDKKLALVALNAAGQAIAYGSCTVTAKAGG